VFACLNLTQPNTLEEAYRMLVNKRNNTVLGGCAFLRLGSQSIDTAVDLSKLNLQYISAQHDDIEIGAMTTFRDIETSPVLHDYFNGVLPKSVSSIIGVQFRNIVTVGATVYSKYVFSDLITALLALDTEVELYKGGRMPLDEFLDKPYEKDILIKIFIKRNQRKAAYQNLRNSVSDYPILNVAVSRMGDKWRIVAGARPQRAAIAKKASAELTKGNLSIEQIDVAANMAAEELSFGTNMRGTAEYRQAVCSVLVKRAIAEVVQCK
jgi:CO/xanthine dehydrogenase FAD-binding subunit